ncbi:MAG: Xaa-Pro peptidase family protein [Chloroflexota bacterium]|nr:Xaa-Pro peptidase family protein [Chloroflexota bacterium]
MNQRLERLRQLLAEKKLDAIFVSQAENRRYLSEFTGSAGFLLVTPKDAILATDFRYTKQAEQQSPCFDIFRTDGAISQWFAELVSLFDIKRIGFESADISFATYRDITSNPSGRELIPTEGVIESLRAVKDEEELKHIIEAIKIADDAFGQAAASLQPGMTEIEAAWQIESMMRDMGSEPLPFDIIVASGPNAALPHHRPTDRPIAAGEPVVIDMGARVEGYASDLSRTITLGKEDDKFGKIYDLVLGAQLTAIATIEAGMSGETSDGLARTVIEQGGYAESFGHGLGHGIGLATHESPRLGQNSPDVLADGMVFTIEPGVYISGWGGVRIEDVVILEQGRARPLTGSNKIR